MVRRRRGVLRVGTSGYDYRHWRGVFYPRTIPAGQRFAYYAERFSTVEINNTFYGLPAPRVFDAWRAQAPARFRYAVKFSRYGSHRKRLKTPRPIIKKFLGRVVRLRDHLGPILVQLPPNWRADPDRLAGFLAGAPAEHRWAVEFRDGRWFCEPVYEVLRRHGAALCIHDLLDDHPREITADWVYLRFHGDHYGGAYPRRFLRREARRCRDWLEQGLDVYAYFNNDRDGHAVSNALDLHRFVDGE